MEEVRLDEAGQQHYEEFIANPKFTIRVVNSKEPGYIEHPQGPVTVDFPAVTAPEPPAIASDKLPMPVIIGNGQTEETAAL